LNINKRIIVDSPKTVAYDAHPTAIEAELDYALYKMIISGLKHDWKSIKKAFWITILISRGKQAEV